MTTRDHYENLLAVYYSWMFGESFADKVAEQRLLLEQFGAIPAKRRLTLALVPVFRLSHWPTLVSIGSSPST
jgi:hypothetical protein